VASFDQAIPPGGVGKVTLQVNTKGFKGKITKSASVYTNEPDQKPSKIFLTLTVRQYIAVEPASRLILQGTVGDEVRKSVTIKAGDEQPFEITDVLNSLGSLIEYKLTRQEEGGHYQLEVIGKSTEKNSKSGYLSIITTHPHKKEFKIPVHLRITPELGIWPTQIDFKNASRAGKPGLQPKRIVTITNHRRKSFRLLQMQYNKDYFHVRSLTPMDQAQKSYRLEIVPLLDKLPEDQVSFEDTLTINTDVAQGGELKVPLTIQIRETQKSNTS
jgi:hypothetical protein